MVFKALTVKYATLGALLTVLCSCGGGGVNFSAPDTSSDCSDNGSTVTSSNLTVTVTGTACDAPSPTSPSSGVAILDCTDRDTDDGDIDFVTATCGSGDSAATTSYYCDTEVVILKDDAGDETLFAQTQVTCTVDSEGTGSIEDEELVVSNLTGPE